MSLQRVLLIVLGLFLMVPWAIDAQVRVRGYVRKDGTYVPPHMRSTADGNPYNNWTYPGNVNPYTGKVATGDPLTYLERYYRSTSSLTFSASKGALPNDLTANLGPLPGAVPLEELERVRSHCRAASQTINELDKCLTRQSYAVAGLALPDYRAVPKSDLVRGANYCEQLYGDDRAGFYNCLNRQIVGLSGPTADLSAASTSDRERATRYCGMLYGDDRAGNANCLRRQAAEIPSAPAKRPAHVGSNDWQRSVRYCETLYGDDRAGYANCLSMQEAGLSSQAPSNPTSVASSEWNRSVRYCETLYGDDRAGFSNCVSRQQAGLANWTAPEDGALPRSEWDRSVRYCELLYGDDRAGANSCRSRQRIGLLSRREPYSSARASQCAALYGDDRAGYWACAARPR